MNILQELHIFLKPDLSEAELERLFTTIDDLVDGGITLFLDGGTPRIVLDECKEIVLSFEELRLQIHHLTPFFDPDQGGDLMVSFRDGYEPDETQRVRWFDGAETLYVNWPLTEVKEEQ